jgi:uncharacterized membrane protein YphA (DoxX/SURF4 family)
MMKLIALVLLVGVFVGAGVDKIQQPAGSAEAIMQSPFPKYLAKAATAAGVKIPFAKAEALLLTQAIGGAFCLFSLMVVVGVCRSFGAIMLALMLVPITAFIHLNIENPAKTDMGNMIHCMKNASIIGGLLYVAVTSCGSCKSSSKAAAVADKKKKQ